MNFRKLRSNFYSLYCFLMLNTQILYHFSNEKRIISYRDGVIIWEGGHENPLNASYCKLSFEIKNLRQMQSN